jgi:hypothetical protein
VLTAPPAFPVTRASAAHSADQLFEQCLPSQISGGLKAYDGLDLVVDGLRDIGLEA